ncbi:hypothetical protein BVU17_11920 [Haloarcula taiwanensis]|uniref:DUF8054 domain-containing protein n=1 Tax=Haloarcula taiwanensis TaxID=1932004 RepID=A0A2H5A0G0_9EURY|nr:MULTISPECIES: hypothetical protein [Haloarcula]AUG48195.1 hypothetical protein BVU17_11920 [Haloarcula taiwanensis]RLM39551.1 hypothetical protein DVK01_03030 [Haloarcula sp. Atlit-120R]RLM47516.1 hypothetical protein DVK00_03130 [Haloarcula sp. Atlit-47R]RLM97281.1 hypothetical protein D3D01_05640 [Haloarcula sp. Atlit-7R]
MKLPCGRLDKSRVVTDPRDTLADVLNRELTGYAVFESQETLLLDGKGRGVITFTDGVPVLVYHTGTDRGGPPALADLAIPGPYHVSLYALDAADLESAHEAADLRVPPGMPAERLGGDPALADSTRRAAPDERLSVTDDDATAVEDEVAEQSAVEAFLDDTEKIEAIKQQARSEARERAQQWDF